MKKAILFTLCSLFIAATTISCGSKQKTDEQSEPSTATEIKTEATKSKYIKMAEAVNKEMPAVLPGGIRWDRVEALSGNEFKYFYTFTQTPVISSEEFIKISKIALATGIKESSDMETFRKDKMNMIYAYYTIDGKLFAEIKITPQEYLK